MSESQMTHGMAFPHITETCGKFGRGHMVCPLFTIEVWFNCFPDKLLVTVSFSPPKIKISVILSPPIPFKVKSQSVLLNFIFMVSVLIRVEKYLSQQKHYNLQYFLSSITTVRIINSYSFPPDSSLSGYFYCITIMPSPYTSIK